MVPDGDIHIILCPGAGHVHSVDCWCEPKDIFLRNVEDYGVMLIVHHNDETHDPHMILLQRRERDRDKDEPNTPEAAWITRVLSSLYMPPDQRSHEC